ncbi:MAG: flagellar motor protein [Cyanobacteria bacterium]|nr:flagellar motor protein [Cyanobacteriota bacterium]
MDIFSLIGAALGLFAVLGGALLEGLGLNAIVQPTAFIIVMGGTAGAVLLSHPGNELSDCVKYLPGVFLPPKENMKEIIESLVNLALKARKEGILALQGDIRDLSDPFLKKGLELMTDGTDPDLLRDLLETELRMFEEEIGHSAKVFESAGGFSPTVGILGAVLGLIHVMENLNDPAKLGSGIAVAFVATVYGVGFANLIALPLANKIKFKGKGSILAREMMIEGILSIQAGESPNFIREKLKVFLSGKDAKEAQAEVAE